MVGDRALGREYFPDDQVGDLFYKGLINNKKTTYLITSEITGWRLTVKHGHSLLAWKGLIGKRLAGLDRDHAWRCLHHLNSEGDFDHDFKYF